MTKVLATGVFNIIHPGHILFLEEAKKLGDELIVIVSSDKIAGRMKKGVLPQEQRAKVVSQLKPVDKAFVGDDADTMKLLPVLNPDVIALGHDQKVDESTLRDKLAVMGLAPKIVRISSSLEGMSSSGILRRMPKP
jgi:FAD synthetase